MLNYSSYKINNIYIYIYKALSKAMNFLLTYITGRGSASLMIIKLKPSTRLDLPNLEDYIWIIER